MTYYLSFPPHLITYYLLLITCYLLPITCYLLPVTYYLLLITYYLLHLSRLIRVLTLYHKYDKLPMLLAHHAFILPLSYRHLYLFTAVTRLDHIREQHLPRP